jgi:hypothetical protein
MLLGKQEIPYSVESIEPWKDKKVINGCTNNYVTLESVPRGRYVIVKKALWNRMPPIGK